MATDKDYLAMQHTRYQERAKVAKVTESGIINEAVVGSYDLQEKFPYDENILKFFKGKLSESSCLEYGCGPGRNLVRLAKRFKHVAGVDISEYNIKNAVKMLVFSGAKDFDVMVTPGDSIPTQRQYDLVFEVICLQHVCSYTIRKRILAEMARVCKPGGMVVCQFGFNNKTLPKSNHNTRYYVDYYEDNFDAQDTNGGWDCCVTDVNQPIKDFMEVGLKSPVVWNTEVVNDVNHDSWLWIAGAK